MKKHIYKPILLFLLSCVLMSPVYALSASIVVMILSMTGLMGINYSMVMVIYLEYILMIDYLFYGSSKKQNAYVASLEKGRKYTVLQDAESFFKQEGIIVLISYAVYAIGAFAADVYMPDTDSLILQICQLVYVAPILPSYMISLPIWLEYLICLVCFSVLYCSVILWHRARIRKKWHS